MKPNLSQDKLIIAAIGVVAMFLMCLVSAAALRYGGGASAVAVNIAMWIFGSLSQTMTGAFSSLYTLVKQESGINLQDAPPGSQTKTTATTKVEQQVETPAPEVKL